MAPCGWRRIRTETCHHLTPDNRYRHRPICHGPYRTLESLQGVRGLSRRPSFDREVRLIGPVVQRCTSDSRIVFIPAGTPPKTSTSNTPPTPPPYNHVDLVPSPARVDARGAQARVRAQNREQLRLGRARQQRAHKVAELVVAREGARQVRGHERVQRRARLEQVVEDFGEVLRRRRERRHGRSRRPSSAALRRRARPRPRSWRR